jgi:hypothetical protein
MFLRDSTEWPDTEKFIRPFGLGVDRQGQGDVSFSRDFDFLSFPLLS